MVIWDPFDSTQKNGESDLDEPTLLPKGRKAKKEEEEESWIVSASQADVIVLLLSDLIVDGKCGSGRTTDSFAQGRGNLWDATSPLPWEQQERKWLLVVITHLYTRSATWFRIF